MNTESILRNSIYGGLALLLIIPLIVTDFMYFPYITGKNFLFRAIVLIIFGLWIALVLKNKKYRPRKSGLFWALGGWVFVMFVANIFGENPIKAFWSNFERMEGWITLLMILLLFVVMTSVMRGKKAWMLFFHASLGVSSIIGTASIIDFLKSGARADVYLGNAAYLGGFLLLHVFIALWLFWRWYRENDEKFYTQGRAWMYIAAVVINTLGLYYTQTRGAILGLIAGLALSSFLIALFEKKRSRVRKSAIGTIVLVVVLVGGFLLIQNTSFVQNNSTLKRFADISLEENTTKTRLIVWESALKGFTERPILGWGQEGFNFVYNKHYNPEMYTAEPWYDRTHNIVLDWLISGGILGVLGYLSLYFFALWFIWKDEEWGTTEKAILTGLLGGYFVHNMFVFDNITSYLVFTYFLAYFHTRRTKDREVSRGSIIENDAVRRTAQAGAVIAGLVLAYMINVPSVTRADTLLDALRYMNQARQTQQSVPEALESFESALELRAPVGAQEVREQFIQNSHYISVMGGVPAETRTAFITSAIAAMENQLEATPNDARILVFLGSLYNQIGQPEQALIFLEQALEASPGKQDILMQMSRAHLALGEYEAARDIMQQTYESAPTENQAVRMYAATLIYTGEVQAAEELLEIYIRENASSEAAQERMRLDIYSDSELIRAYSAVGEYDKAITLLENRVELQQNNIQAWASLAAAYYEAGRISEAIETLEQAKERFPQAATQIDGFIADIRAGELSI